MFFGPGDGPVFLDQVACNGYEERLLDCPNSGLQASTCGHSRDVGVICVPGKISSI